MIAHITIFWSNSASFTVVHYLKTPSASCGVVIITKHTPTEIVKFRVALWTANSNQATPGENTPSVTRATSTMPTVPATIIGCRFTDTEHVRCGFGESFTVRAISCHMGGRRSVEIIPAALPSATIPVSPTSFQRRLCSFCDKVTNRLFFNMRVILLYRCYTSHDSFGRPIV